MLRHEHRSYLGETFDIHGGGMDLIFPHHENEIAQSEGASGKPFSTYWLHNGFIKVDDEKMSKSLGNFFTIRDILKLYDPEVLRFFVLQSHYRSPLDYSEEGLKEARLAMNRPTKPSRRSAISLLPTRHSGQSRRKRINCPRKRRLFWRKSGCYPCASGREWTMISTQPAPWATSLKPSGR